MICLYYVYPDCIGENKEYRQIFSGRSHGTVLCSWCSKDSESKERLTVVQRPDGPNGNLILGSAPDFINNTLQFFDDLRDYGDVTYFRFLWHHDYVVNSPELIREVLITKADHFNKSKLFKQVADQQTLFTGDGDFWKKQRKLLQPAFHTGRIGAYVDVMRDYTLEYTDKWKAGDQRSITDDITEITIRIFTKALFDAEIGEDSYKAAMALNRLVSLFNTLLAGGAVIPRWVPTKTNRIVKESEATLREILMKMIQERRESGEDRGDLLSMMIHATYEDGSKMSDELLYAEVNAMFIAGQEANAGMISWALYMLSQHPDIAQKFYDEVDTVLGDRPVTLDDLNSLTYTDMFIKETLRLYPLAYAFSRDVVKDVELGGYTIPTGASVHISPWSLHRNPAIWDNPETFDPDRFHPEHGTDYGKYDYLPFGGGPRVCIGNHFAMMEAKVCLVTIAQHYRLELAPDYTITPDRQFTIYPSDGLPMIIREREPIVADATV